MRRFFLLPTILFLLTISQQLSAISYPQPVYSQSTVNVAAIVGQLTLNISGYASPNATVIVTSNGITLATVRADSQGAFSFSLNVQNNFSAFCLIATDSGGLKTSSCYTIPPLTQSSALTNLILPPSISSKTGQVYAGENITIFGYTLPGALVTIQINDSETVTVTADENGYYSYTFTNAGVGSYQFNSSSAVGTLTSAGSNKSITVNSVATPQSIEKSEDTTPTTSTSVNQTIKNAINPVQKIAENPFLWLPLLLILFLIILAILAFFIFRKKPWMQNMIVKIKEKLKANSKKL